MKLKFLTQGPILLLNWDDMAEELLSWFMCACWGTGCVRRCVAARSVNTIYNRQNRYGRM